MSFKSQAMATELDTKDLVSTHKEADTKLMRHAIHAAKRGAKCIRIYSSNMDVLAIAIRRVLMLPNDTSKATLGRNARQIKI